MKVFYISCAIFGITFIVVIANAVFTSEFSRGMTESIGRLPTESLEGSREALEESEEYFSRYEFRIMAFNNHGKVHDVHKLFSQIEAAIECGDFSLYTQSRLALCDAIYSLVEFNRISFSEIF